MGTPRDVLLFILFIKSADDEDSLSLCSGRLLVGTFVALFFNLLTLLSVRNKPFAYVSEGNPPS